MDDLPTRALVDQVLADQHLIMADHTTPHWPDELYLPSRVFDRDNRENWTKAGALDADRRATARGGAPARRVPPAEDGSARRRGARADHQRGLRRQTELPFVPPPANDASPAARASGRDAPRPEGPNPRRGR